MSFTEVFGGQNIFPSDLSFLSLVMTTDVTLQWPVEQAVAGQSVYADIIEVTPNAGLNLIFPDARNTSPGQATLVNNIGANTLTVKDNAGNAIGSVPSGQVWQFYLKDNTTQAGVWKTFQFGTGASSAVAAALAGAGLKAITTTLNVKALPRSSGSPVAIVDSDRAAIVSYTGGVGTGTIPTPASLGTDWFTYVRNNGSGSVTITPAAGTINGAATLVLSPFSSTMLYTDGANFFTIGLSQVTPTNFDFTSINVAGTGAIVLAGTQLNRIAYKFTGILTGARTVTVPSTVQQYWVSNATTGAFPLTVQAGGAGVVVPQGYALLLYCDGTDVVAAEGAPGSGLIPVDIGGTGILSYTQGDLLYATATTTLAKLAKSVTATRYLANTGAANAPAWDQVNLVNGVTGRLPLPFTNLDQGAALSVLGVAGTITADFNQIVGGDNQVLRVSPGGTSLVFGAILLSSTSAVTGSLGAQNGGTAQSSTAQGDLLYADAANSWARLAKDTVGVKVLANTGTSNAPQWVYNRFNIGAAANANTTFALTDGYSWVPHTEATTARTYTVPTNASVAFPIGTEIGVDNRAGSGAISMSAASGVTVDGRGASVTGAPTTFFTLPVGYKLLLVKVDTNTWIFYTDAPQAGGVGTDYAGYIQAADASEKFNAAAASWTATNPATGQLTITHNLGLSSATDMVINAQILGGAGDDRTIIVNPGTNSFDVFTADIGSGPVDVDIFFRALRIV